eukprot:5308356-Pyramimonas_sp.AAC.1
MPTPASAQLGPTARRAIPFGRPKRPPAAVSLTPGSAADMTPTKWTAGTTSRSTGTASATNGQGTRAKAPSSPKDKRQAPSSPGTGTPGPGHKRGTMTIGRLGANE